MKLRVLCVHGVGRHPPGGPWEAQWQRAIEEPLHALDPDVVVDVAFVYLDDIFDQFDISPLDVIEALGKLGKSGVSTLLARPEGLGSDVRWTAGMVVQWVENGPLRGQTRERLLQRMQETQPDMVVGHSLGSLVCYDTFTSDPGRELIKGRCFVSAGSQIGNPFVVGQFAAGRITGLSEAKFWYHLYNREDDVFAAAIRLADSNFAQIDTFFDISGVADHDVTAYMRHARTCATVWSDAVMALHSKPLAARGLDRMSKPAVQRLSRGDGRWATKPSKRALLVGINAYGDPKMNLEGCVNDVFLMSALLQEMGFEAQDIRVVLNERATCQGLCERLQWLLEDAQPTDTRFFYYSGHGAQWPQYGLSGQVTRIHEALVPHDFDWTPERAFTDEQFHALYSQLPYDMRFVAMFDCCHSGGLTRGSPRRVRGLEPPDDIRHRMLRWDAKHEMWVARDFTPLNDTFDQRFNAGRATPIQPITDRLGQAMILRQHDRDALWQQATSRGHLGPYLPVLIYACRDDQFAYEYQHGATAHGAFTYSLVKTIRRDRQRKTPKLTFESLVTQVAAELRALGYEQAPNLVAPADVGKMLLP